MTRAPVETITRTRRGWRVSAGGRDYEARTLVNAAGAWADRIAKGNEVLYASGVNGVPGTGMIAKGGCMNCSDEEIHAAVDYMVAGSQ